MINNNNSNNKMTTLNMKFTIWENMIRFRVNGTEWDVNNHLAVFEAHSTAVERRLDISGANDCFFLSVLRHGVLVKNVAIRRDRAEVDMMREELDRWLRMVDATRKRRFYADCVVRSKCKDGKIEVQAAESGERYLVRQERVPLPRAVGETVTLSKYYLADHGSLLEERDELEGKAGASSSSAPASPTDEDLLAQFPFPYKYGVRDAEDGAVDVVRDKPYDLKVWIVRPASELSVRAIDKDGQTAVLVFHAAKKVPGTPGSFMNFEVPRDVHERVLALWRREVDKINAFARKLAGETEASSSAASSSKPEPASTEKKEEKEPLGCAEQFLKAILCRKQACLILAGVEDHIGRKVEFRDGQRQEFLDKLTTEIGKSMDRFDSHDKWTQHCVDYAAELVKEVMLESKSAFVFGSLIAECARGALEEVEEELGKNGPIYRSGEQRVDAFRQVGAKMCELLQSNEVEQDSLSDAARKFTQELLERIQKENRAKYSVCRAEAIAAALSKLASGDEVPCGLFKLDLDSGEMTRISGEEKKEEAAPSSEAPASPAPEEDEEPEQNQDPDVVGGTTRYGLNLSYNRETRKLRIGGRIATLPKLEKGGENSAPSVYEIVDKESDRFLSIIVNYRGKSKCVARMDSARDASLFCQDLGDWLLGHHKSGFFD